VTNNAIKKLIANAAMHIIETDNWDHFNNRALILYAKTEAGFDEVREALEVEIERLNDDTLGYFFDRFLRIHGKHLIKLLESDLPRGDLIKMFAEACLGTLLLIMGADRAVNKLQDARSVNLNTH
jgi:hypothetical protein